MFGYVMLMGGGRNIPRFIVLVETFLKPLNMELFIDVLV